jgi:hypothetical protein
MQDSSMDACPDQGTESALCEAQEEAAFLYMEQEQLL